MARTMPDTTRGGTTTSPFGYPAFRAMWVANLASNFGGMIHAVAAAWLMASITQSPTMVALVQASVSLPIMLLSLVSGALADSLDRRIMMLSAQCFMLTVSVALTLCAWTGALTPWLLLTFTFLIGCGTAANTPAWQASVGDLVPRSELSSAVSLNSMGFNIARSVGPAVGGAIVAGAGAAAAFVLNALSYVGLIGVLARWRPERAEQAMPRETLGVAIGAGLRYVAMSPAILAVLLRGGIFGFAASAVTALLPIVTRDILVSGPLSYGFLLGAFGIGAVSGALGGARLRRRLSAEWIVRYAALVWTAGAALAAISPVLPLTMFAMMLAGLAFLLALSTFNVTVQLSSPRWVVARTLSLYQMVTFGGMALGSWIWGELAADVDPRTALLAAAGVQLLTVLVGLRAPMPEAQNLDLNPLRRWQEPQVSVPLLSRSGPIIVTIEYRIAPEDQRAFLEAMVERRRIRRRDGARNWNLLHDLGEPELWLERYHTPTWLDYVRHNSRTTIADREITERIRALHRGDEPPKVRRMIERQPGRHDLTGLNVVDPPRDLSGEHG